MKKLSLLFLFGILYLPLTGSAQTFEGTVKYRMKLLNLPPGMDEAQMAQVMPSNFVYKFSNSGAMRFSMNGMMAMEILLMADQKGVYVIDDSKKKLYLMAEKDLEKHKNEKMLPDAKQEVTKTTETETVAGYMCTRYNIKTTSAKGTIVSAVWTTEKLKAPKMKFDSQGLFTEKVPGMPLKMVTEVSGMTMIMTAEEVKPEKLAASNFQKPTGYTEEPFSPEALMK